LAFEWGGKLDCEQCLTLFGSKSPKELQSAGEKSEGGWCRGGRGAGGSGGEGAGSLGREKELCQGAGFGPGKGGRKRGVAYVRGGCYKGLGYQLLATKGCGFRCVQRIHRQTGRRVGTLVIRRSCLKLVKMFLLFVDVCRRSMQPHGEREVSTTTRGSARTSPPRAGGAGGGQPEEYLTHELPRPPMG